MSVTLGQAWAAARTRLSAAGIDSPAIDARLLLEAAGGVSRLEIISDSQRVLSEEQEAVLEGYLERRARREPVSQILGRKGFWTIQLSVNNQVLTPRPDTETLVDWVLKSFPQDRAFRVLDLGVGSGAILLAILAERPAGKGLGVDISEDALAVARENAANLGLEGRMALLRGDWTQGLADASFELVVSNPPYIRSDEIETLQPEVRDHEPRLALDGGSDGLNAYRAMALEVLRVLVPGGRFALEIGFDQAAAVEALMREAGARELAILKDLGERDRVVVGAKAI